MQHFLDDRFDPVYLQQVSEVQSQEYYVNMMIAWYFATALASRRKQRFRIWNSINWIPGSTTRRFRKQWRVTGSVTH